MWAVSDRARSSHLGNRAPNKEPVIDADLHEAVFQQRNEDTLNERAGAGLDGAQHVLYPLSGTRCFALVDAMHLMMLENHKD